jgi:hypothetical protein
LLDKGICESPGYNRTSGGPSSASAGLGYLLVERPRYHQRQQRALVGHYRLGQVLTPRIPRNQQPPFVSHYWRQVCAGREAKIREDSKTNILPSPAITGSGMRVGREPSKPQIPQDSRANVMPSSASTDSGMCVGGKVSKPQIPQRPATSRRLPVQTRASAGREAKKKVGKCSNQRTSLRMENTNKRDFALR